MPPSAGQPVSDDLFGATRMESDEEIQQALEARRARLSGAAPPTATSSAAKVNGSAPAPVDEETQVERPLERPAVAMLCILDDGKSDGEWVRLRSDRCVIGRTEGDIRIPHDAQISGRHVELVRRRGPRGVQWVLTDLRSTNGTFIRIGSSLLNNPSEVLIGRGHYRFEMPNTAPPATPTGGASTQNWTGGLLAHMPSFLEVLPGGTGHRFPLGGAEYWIGRDRASCQIVRADDPFVSPRHARLYRNARGQWHIENNKSVNGVWLRIHEVPLTGACQFRVGEQKFLLRMS